MNEEEIPCKFCELSFFTKIDLGRHLAHAHSDEEEVKSKITELTSSLEGKPEPKVKEEPVEEAEKKEEIQPEEEEQEDQSVEESIPEHEDDNWSDEARWEDIEIEKYGDEELDYEIISLRDAIERAKIIYLTEVIEAEHDLNRCLDERKKRILLGRPFRNPSLSFVEIREDRIYEEVKAYLDEAKIPMPETLPKFPAPPPYRPPTKAPQEQQNEDDLDNKSEEELEREIEQLDKELGELKQERKKLNWFQKIFRRDD